MTKFLIALLLFLFVTPSALCQTQSGHIEIQQELDKERHRQLKQYDCAIVLKLVELARFNVHFRQEANKHWWIRDWIYPWEQEAATSLSFSGTLSDLVQRGRGYNDPDKINKRIQKEGTKRTLTGEIIAASSSAAELADNLFMQLRAGAKGYSPRKSVRFVQHKLAEIDQLLIERSCLVAQFDENCEELILDGRLFLHTRNQLMREFKMFSVDSRGQAWMENWFYALNTGQHFTGMAANICSLKAFDNPRFTPKAAITNIVASSISVVNPLLKPLVGAGVRKYWRGHLAKLLPDRGTAGEIDPDMLEQLADQSDESDKEKGKQPKPPKQPRQEDSDTKSHELAFTIPTPKTNTEEEDSAKAKQPASDSNTDKSQSEQKEQSKSESVDKDKDKDKDKASDKDNEKSKDKDRASDAESDEKSHLKELAWLARQSSKSDDTIVKEAEKIAKLRWVPAQKAIVGTMTGGASLSRQICNEIAYSKYRKHDIISNRLNLAGRIVQLSGQGWQMIDNPIGQFRHYLKNAELKKQEKLPSQLLDKRLKHLDEIEKKTKKWASDDKDASKDKDSGKEKDPSKE